VLTIMQRGMLWASDSRYEATPAAWCWTPWLEA
jgi:hypothetical protein